MASRFYLPNTNTSATISPPFHSSWGNVTNAKRRMMDPVPSIEGFNGLGEQRNEGSATAPFAWLYEQWISPPIDGNVNLEGRVRAAAQAGSNTYNRAKVRWVARIVSNDGSEIRSELGLFEMNGAMGQNFMYWYEGFLDFEPVTVQLGDRFVIERGVYYYNNAAWPDVNVWVGTGYKKNAIDVYARSGSTTLMNENPWFELSQDDIWIPSVKIYSTMSEVGIKTESPTTVVSAVQAESLLQDNVANPALINSIQVESLIAVDHIVPRNLVHSAGNPLKQIKMKMPDGSWKGVWGRGQTKEENPELGVRSKFDISMFFHHANSQMSIADALGPLIKPDDTFLLSLSVSGTAPTTISDPGGSIPGIEWNKVYSDETGRNRTWIGTGATSHGTITFPSHGSNWSILLMIFRNPIEIKSISSIYDPDSSSTGPRATLAPTGLSAGELAIWHGYTGGTVTVPDPDLSNPSSWNTLQGSGNARAYSYWNPSAPVSNPVEVVRNGSNAPLAAQLIIVK